MIRYSLRCRDGHAFDSWFRSAEDCDRLIAGGHLACPDCGAGGVAKAPMAPAVQSAARTAPLAEPASPREAALAALRRHVEENSDYVGLSFAAEARAMHEGRAPERAIHGEARPDEARALVEDGVPVALLPFLPARKVN